MPWCGIKLWWVLAGRFSELGVGGGWEEEEGRRNEKEASYSAEQAGPSLEALTGQAARSSPWPPNNPGILSCDPLPLPSEWASLEVAAPPLALTPPGLAEYRALPGWWGTPPLGLGSPLRAAGDNPFRVPSIGLADSRPFHWTDQTPGAQVSQQLALWLLWELFLGS